MPLYNPRQSRADEYAASWSRICDELARRKLTTAPPTYATDRNGMTRLRSLLPTPAHQ